MISLHATKCCAVGEIDNLSKHQTPEDALKFLYPLLKKGLKPVGHGDSWGWHRVPIVTFTGVTRRVMTDHASGRCDDYGQAFADYLLSRGLGDVVRSGEVKNWTANGVRLWTWTPNYEALDKWAAENGVKGD